MNTKAQSRNSQADSLEAEIKRLEAKHGPDDHFVTLLRAQLDSLRNRSANRPNPVTLHVGTRN